MINYYMLFQFLHFSYIVPKKMKRCKIFSIINIVSSTPQPIQLFNILRVRTRWIFIIRLRDLFRNRTFYFGDSMRLPELWNPIFFPFRYQFTPFSQHKCAFTRAYLPPLLALLEKAAPSKCTLLVINPSRQVSSFTGGNML